MDEYDSPFDGELAKDFELKKIAVLWKCPECGMEKIREPASNPDYRPLCSRARRPDGDCSNRSGMQFYDILISGKHIGALMENGITDDEGRVRVDDQGNSKNIEELIDAVCHLIEGENSVEVKPLR